MVTLVKSAPRHLSRARSVKSVFLLSNFYSPGIGIMKPSMKMGVIALIGICVVFYQYHLSTGVTFDQVTAFNGAAADDAGGGLPIGEESGDNYSKTPRLTEDMVSAIRD